MKSSQIAVLILVAAAAAICHADLSDTATTIIQQTEDQLDNLDDTSASPAAGPSLSDDLADLLSPFNISAKAPGPQIDSKVKKLTTNQTYDILDGISNILDEANNNNTASDNDNSDDKSSNDNASKDSNKDDKDDDDATSLVGDILDGIFGDGDDAAAPSLGDIIGDVAAGPSLDDIQIFGDSAASPSLGDALSNLFSAGRKMRR